MPDSGSGLGSPGRSTHARAFLAQELTASWGDAVLILSCFVTGLLDSAVFNVWSCFVSMQTGNTVYVGLGVSGQPEDQPWRWCKSLVAVGSFIGGSYVFSRTMRHFGATRRGTIVGSHVVQALLVFIAAILRTSDVVPRDAGDRLPETFIVLLPLALLSMQSAGQCVMSRVLGYGEIPTVVLTSAYCDLGWDEAAWAPLKSNSKRNRRVLSTVMLLAGAISGGFLTEGGDLLTALWIAGFIKSSMAGIWLFWRAEGAIQLD